MAYFGASKIATEENQPALFLLGGVILTAFSITSFINNAVKNKKVKKAKAVEETKLLKYVVKGFLLNIINISYLVIWLSFVFGLLCLCLALVLVCVLALVLVWF